ncbi:MAG: oxidoreductase coenzyme F420-dependent [Microbacterium sp.]|jgi:predicted dinucleotide-binding enzyme|uniref:NADPH-dependent F420 reductase n=1 Tax=Microbacterium sp. TaxID=51671 RepID=UPI00260ED0B6|nr:NAD(P)-binding domain-containing protein [Microbacterium sp.]MDF2559562.1 oxidoreductase coenzyme F420-dependent [Microbacterium sp.]
MTTTTPTDSSTLRIALIGAGNVARALGSRWAAAGHQIVIGERSSGSAGRLATQVGKAAATAAPSDAARWADVVLLAVPWADLDDALALAGAADGALSGKVVIDPTNPVAHGDGRHLLEHGSAAENIAVRAPGAHIVKAFNVYPADHWKAATAQDVVALAGDDDVALDTVGRLVRAVGAVPHTVGGLHRARQIEELAGMVIALAFAGIDPRASVPGLSAGDGDVHARDAADSA